MLRIILFIGLILSIGISLWIIFRQTSTPSPSPGWLKTGAPWVFLGSLGFLFLTLMRVVPIYWGVGVTLSVLGVGASFFVKDGWIKRIGLFLFGVIIFLQIGFAWLAPDAPKSVEGLQPGTSILTPSPSTPQEQASPSPTPSPTPTPEAPIARERIARVPGKAIVLTKSKIITLPPGQKDICFSWLGDSTGRWNQSLEIGSQTFSTQGSDCFPVTQEGSVEVKFLNPPQTEVDTYKFAREQPNGQGEYPFIKLVK